MTLQGAKLRNGVVKGCKNGVVLKGTGNHKVERVLATDNADDGFVVDPGSDKNTLNRNAATDNGDDGFQVGGDQTKLNNNTSTTNKFGYFIFCASSQNRVIVKTAAQNTIVGFLLDGGTGNKVIKNVGQQNGTNGIEIYNSGHTVRQNQTFDNGDDGIQQNGTDSKLQKNTALGNGDDDLDDDSATCDNNDWKQNIFGLANRLCIE